MSSIGIDLNENNTLIYVKNKGILTSFNETETIDIKNLKIKNLILRPTMLICTRSSISILEKEKLITLGKRLGGKKIYICSKLKALLIGSKIDISKASATAIINIDNNIIDIGILSLGELIINKTIKINKKTDYVKEVSNFFKNLKPEILVAVKEKGITLSGNKNLLSNISPKLRKELNIPVFTIDDPSKNVSEGMKVLLNNPCLIED